MHSYKLYISIIATIIGLVSYWPYLVGTIKKTVRPSTSTWLVWSILTTVAFGAQLASGGGIGSLITGTSALISFIVMGFAIRSSRQAFTQLDWTCLAAALVAIGLWVATKDPLISVLIVTVVTLVGYVPTFYKSHSKPNEENATTYSIGMIKFAASIVALSNYSVATTVYPATMIAANAGLVTFLVIRRNQLAGRAMFGIGPLLSR